MPRGIPKDKRHYYEVVITHDLPWFGPDQRRERWPRKGQRDVQPMSVLHSMRVNPSNTYDGRGRPIPGHYIVTDRPVGRNYTEEVVKNVSRRESSESSKRVMRPKTSEIKLRLLDPDEVSFEIQQNAHDENWGPDLFENHTEDVVLPVESARMALEGAKANAQATAD